MSRRATSRVLTRARAHSGFTPDPISAGPCFTVRELDRPEPAAGRLARLRGRLSRSQGLGKGLLALLSRDKLDEQTWDEIEETLLVADVGVGPATELVANLRAKVRSLPDRTTDDVRRMLRDELLSLVGPTPTGRWPPTPTAGPPSCSWWESTAPARPRRSASSRACSSPTGARCCSARLTRSARRRPTSWRPGASGSVPRSCAVRRPATRRASRSTRCSRASTADTTSCSSTPPDACRTRSG